MAFSVFGDKFAGDSGITQLMHDLNDGLTNPNAIMLGGGNPAQIPAMVDYFNQLLVDMAATGELTNSITNYDDLKEKTFLLLLLPHSSSSTMVGTSVVKILPLPMVVKARSLIYLIY